MFCKVALRVMSDVLVECNISLSALSASLHINYVATTIYRGKETIQEENTLKGSTNILLS